MMNLNHNIMRRPRCCIAPPLTFSSSPRDHQTQEIFTPKTPSAELKRFWNELMNRAHTILEFTLENLEKLQGHIFISLREQIPVLFEDLKYLRTLFRKMQEKPSFKPMVLDWIADILHEVSKLFHATDFYVHWYMVKNVENFDTASDLIENIKSFEERHVYVFSHVTDLIKEIKTFSNEISWSQKAISLPATGSNPKIYSLWPYEDISDLANEVKTLLRDVPSDPYIRYRSCLRDANEVLKMALESLRKLLILGDFTMLSVYADLVLLSFLPSKVSPDLLEKKAEGVAGKLLAIVNKHINSSSTDIRDQVLCLPQISDLVREIKSVDVLIDDSESECSFSRVARKLLDIMKENIDSSSTYIRYQVLCFPQFPEVFRKIKYIPIDDGSDEAECSSTNKIMIGMEDETRILQDRLIFGLKELELIPVIGMAGIGKTSLTRKLYNDPSIASHFHIPAWTSVSQSYQKRKSLRDILSCIVGDKDPVLSLGEEDIGERLRKCLKGNRYLIVLDDLWDVKVWNDLKIYLPDDHNSSRVVITSRNKDVIPESMLGNPCFLRFLTEDESWDLFKCKAFGGESLSEDLIEVGKELVATCKGLPIAIVVLGGLLAKEEKTKEKWRKLAGTIRQTTNNDDNLVNILALSYNHLPLPLKSCFLSLGSFPEDYEFSVKWLIRSWIAQGFVESRPEKKLEDVAAGYLTNLIDRSLLTVAKKSSDGGIKSCQLHDLLRNLCIRKADEKEFLQPICCCESMDNSFYHKLKLSDYCHYFHLCYSEYVEDHVFQWGDAWAEEIFLRVCDMRRVIFDKFPEKIFELFHLKYLALQVERIESLPSSIFELWNLETFILEVEKGGRVELSPSIMKMKRLRHFHVSGELFCVPKKSSEFRYAGELHNLQTVSNLTASDSMQALLSGTPNLRKLGLYANVSNTEVPFPFPSLSFLQALESLKFEYQTFGMKPFNIPSLLGFPQSLKKLNLIGSHADWMGISILGELPNLEVLKLKHNFFSGPIWETSDNGFPCLKYLKLSHLDLKQWVCSSSDHFPTLEQLVLNGCLDLEEIPSEIGYIPTLQAIEVYRSSESVAESARQIRETQNSSMGNDGFKLFISSYFQEL